MGETIAILVIFFFLLVFGLSFYMNFFKRSVANKAHDFFELEAIETIQKVVFLPELQCTDMDIQIDSCFDVYKIQAFKKIIDYSRVFDPNAEIWLEYTTILGHSRLTVTPIYPEGSPIMIYNNTYSDYQYRPVVNIPISLYNATSDTYALGVLELVYTKKDNS